MIKATADPLNNTEFDLQALLRPMASAAFLADHWEREPLLLRRAGPAFYDSLVQLKDIEAFISRGDARYPAIRLAKDGGFYPPEAYSLDFKFGDEFFRGVPDVEKIHAEYSSGASITLPAWHRSWPPLGALCTRLEAQLDHVVNTNVYLTPAGARGFLPHYDTHEVFVLQISGRKHWQVYPPPLALPHRTQTFAPERYVVPAEPLLSFDLAAGDLLYLPRGYVHTTSTSSQSSTHITIGVTVYTWVELLMELAQQAIEDPEFRHGLPPGFAHGAEMRSQVEREFARLLPRLSQQADIESVVPRFLQRVGKAKPRAAKFFNSDANIISPQTQLCVAKNINYSFLLEHEQFILMLDGRRINLQVAAEPMMQAMSRAESFSPQELAVDIGIDARLALVRFLHGLGFLVKKS